MRTRRTVLAVSLVVVGFCAAACGLLGGSQGAPGGTPYSVTETLSTDTCGMQSDGVRAVTQFDARLAANAMTGLANWQVGASGSGATGSFDAPTRSFEFVDDETVQLRAALPAYGIAACVVRRLDVIQGRLGDPVAATPDAGAMDAAEGDDASTDAGAQDAGVVYTTFAATETITVGPVTGADCSDQVGVNDGQYLALPCQQSFMLAGTAEVADQ